VHLPKMVSNGRIAPSHSSLNTMRF